MLKEFQEEENKRFDERVLPSFRKIDQIYVKMGVQLVSPLLEELCKSFLVEHDKRLLAHLRKEEVMMLTKAAKNINDSLSKLKDV